MKHATDVVVVTCEKYVSSSFLSWLTL